MREGAPLSGSLSILRLGCSSLPLVSPTLNSSPIIVLLGEDTGGPYPMLTHFWKPDKPWGLDLVLSEGLYSVPLLT